MVQWLLQNSLGRSYHEINPYSSLPQTWSYYVKPEKLDTTTHFTLASLTLLDPCVGSGHFLRAAFDMFVGMYREQFPNWNAQDIADRILTNHLFGIDLDPRAAQLTALTLYLRAWELVRDERQQQYLPGGSYTPPSMNIATTPTNLDKGALERHLQRHPQDRLFEPLIKEIFAGLEQAELLGSLLRPRKYLNNAITLLQKQHGIQRSLFNSDMDELRIKIAELAKSDPEGLKKLALQRVTDSFKSEAGNVDDVSAMLFGREAEQGVHLMQLLDQQYAVVVTNPPYMGSKNMDTPLKKYVEKFYSSGRRDLYAAFILRCLELCKSDGRVAMVTQQNWMFLRSFTDLRVFRSEKLKQEQDKFKGILRETCIECLTQLGRYAFSEIGNAVVAPLLLILRNSTPTSQHRIWSCRLSAPRPSEEQASILLSASKSMYTTGIVFTPVQIDLLTIPESPIVYWLQSRFFELLKSTDRLGSIAKVRTGLQTSDNERFIRCFWEAQINHSKDRYKNTATRWTRFVKGGGYCKWAGLEWLCIDWQYDGTRIRAFPQSFLRSPEFYFKEGLTYTLMASGCFSARVFDQGIFDLTGISIFPNEQVSRQSILAWTSTHVVSYLLRVTTQNLKFLPGYVTNLPVILSAPFEIFNKIGEICVIIKYYLVSSILIEQNFNLESIRSNKTEELEAILHTLEGLNDILVNKYYKLDKDTIQVLINETGTPAGWYPLITNYDSLPSLPSYINLPPLPQELFNYLTQHKRINLNSKELHRIKANICAFYEAGPGVNDVKHEENHEKGSEIEDGEEIVTGSHTPIPTETFLEELSVKMQLHPISVYWLLEELRAEGARCLPEERRILEDRLSVIILRLLGHRWPKQIEAEESVPTWAVHNGIIPLVSSTGKRTLAELLRERLREESGDIGAQQTEALLEELTGQSLEEWLRRRFFLRHVSQFKSRPVAWHLASTPGKTANGKGKKGRGGGIQRKPAFECILYYHSCTTNALARIRNEYVEPLIQAERGKIAQGKNEVKEGQLFDDDSLVDDTASATASERIRELTAFADRLRTIEEQGFACDELQKLLANERLDRWSGDGYLSPISQDELLRQEQGWHVDINDGVRVNIAPLQLVGILASDVLKAADARKAIADRARWRSDERRWVRDGKLPRCGWMDKQIPASEAWDELEPQRIAEQQKLEQKRQLLQQGKLLDEVNGIEEEEVFQ